jgi:hypothetical protein
MNNSVQSWKDASDSGARGLSDCVEGRWRDSNHARKCSKKDKMRSVKYIVHYSRKKEI